MYKLGLALLLALATTPAFAGTEIDAAGQTVTHDCSTDAELSVTGSGNQVTVTGACTLVDVMGSGNEVTIATSAKVAITGSSNKVHVDASDRISISGSSNQLTWKKGLKSKKPKVSRSGVGNTVKQVK